MRRKKDILKRLSKTFKKVNLIFRSNCMSSVCHSYILVCHPYVPRIYSYVIPMLLVYIRMSFLCHSYVFVCHPYVTPMYSYAVRMSLVCTRYLYIFVCHSYVTCMYSHAIPMSLVCTRMFSVCHSYVLVCHPYVTCMYSYVIRMSLLCTRISSVCQSFVCMYLNRISLLCTCIPSVCQSFVLVCRPYVTHMYSYVNRIARMFSYVIRMPLVCGFTMDLLKPSFDCFLTCSILEVTCNINTNNLVCWPFICFYVLQINFLLRCLINALFLASIWSIIRAYVLVHFLVFTIYLTCLSVRILFLQCWNLLRF